MTGNIEVQVLLELIRKSATEALDEYGKYGDGVPSVYETNTHPLDEHKMSLRLKKAIRNLEGACDQLCATLAPPLHTIVNRAQDYYWSCLRVAAQNKIADLLDNTTGGMNLESLAHESGIEPSKLRILMRTLAARHCFQEVSHDVYANTRLSLVLHSHSSHTSYIDLLTKEGQESAGNFQKYLSDNEYSQCNDSTHTVFTHAVKDTGFHGTVYDWMKVNGDRRAVMSSSMPSMNSVMGTLSIIEGYPWEKISTVCDVGCGNGSFVWSLLQKFPQIHVTLFDLHETLEAAKQAAGCLAQELQSHLHFQPGDFFKDSLPKSVDMYYLRNIIHNWPDKDVLTILASIKNVMGPQSRILIHDYTMHSFQNQSPHHSLDQAPWPMLPDFGNGSMRLHYQDLTMLFMYNSKERTLEEVKNLSQNAGLKLEQIRDLGETTVLEFGPA
ncbi:S-adenosyl-L-methionine-dependent methyltransferase [Lentinula edodes]|uniref:S-adenosyl-L-methionine-dependent methyltransferase n=1 Tax=Lentinula edodes TaxID=5353 RepID=UPI001E8E963F|nr:S-adenosyl-L-methionine-dependent methyltransferase [Lentinula edodes]KAH7879245.1 S-adenosyl-L-methionine-dependent methyltransferase [Lentinula edodes]